MENKFKLILVIAIVALILIFVKLVFLSKTNEQKIRQIIYSAKTATEKEDLFKCISYVSLEYKDKEGNDRPTLFLIGKNVFQNYDDIFIIIEDLKINIVNNTKAEAHIWASGQGKRQTGEKFSYIVDTQKVEFEVVFQKEGNIWKVVELKFIQPENFLQLLKGL